MVFVEAKRGCGSRGQLMKDEMTLRCTSHAAARFRTSVFASTRVTAVPQISTSRHHQLHLHRGPISIRINLGVPQSSSVYLIAANRVTYSQCRNPAMMSEKAPLLATPRRVQTSNVLPNSKRQTIARLLAIAAGASLVFYAGFPDCQLSLRNLMPSMSPLTRAQWWVTSPSATTTPQASYA
jgi:hypothetical protein